MFKILKTFFSVSLFFIISLQNCLAADLDKLVKEHTLKNGLKILMLERHTSPTIATSIMFKAGAIDEEAGLTGIAHFLEHMLFKGTKTLGTTDFENEAPLLIKIEEAGEKADMERSKGEKSDPLLLKKLETTLSELQQEHKKFVKKDEFAEIYSKNGGVGYNAWTNVDVTSYIISLPANKLELWASIESDRMKNPVLREFYQERDVIIEERRSSYDNNPDGMLYETLIATAFNASPYSHPTIGWPSDIRTLPQKKVREFLETFYAPNNAVISIVGDIDSNQVIEMADRYFGDIPSKIIPERRFTLEPEQLGERRISIEFDSNPQIMIAWHKPTLPDIDNYVFDLIDYILAGGRTSRLYKRLVLEEKVAVSVYTFGVPGSRLPNLFAISATPRAPHSTAEAEKFIYEEIEKLKTTPVSSKELKKILNNMEAEKIKKMRSNSGMSAELTHYQILAGDWRYSVTYMDKIREITPEQIMETVKKYFKRQNRTVATLVKKEETNNSDVKK